MAVHSLEWNGGIDISGSEKNGGIIVSVQHGKWSGYDCGFITDELMEVNK